VSMSWSTSGSGLLNSITDTYTNTRFTPDNPTVPGPLPILGAGAAFGCSRKLRRRIKQSLA
jgi:hypothetical protein